MSVEHYTYEADFRPMQDTEQQEYEEAWGGVSRTTYDRFYGQAPAVDRCNGKEREMAFVVSDSGGGDFKRVPPGTHLARCYRVIDLGTQETSWQGQIKTMRKMQLSWELFGEDEEGNPLQTEDGMPLVISKRYTSSLGEKANLRKDLESWRGKPFMSDELKGFDVQTLLDKWCMLSVIHNEDNGKTYANVTGIVPVPKALKGTLPKGVHEIEAFDVDNPDMELFDTFHAKLQETIKSSEQWRSREYGGTRVTAPPPGHPANFDDDDIPF